MQDGAFAFYRYGKGVSRVTGKYAEHGSSSGGYKTRGRKKVMTISNNPDYLTRPLVAECGNIAKGKSGGVSGGR